MSEPKWPKGPWRVGYSDGSGGGRPDDHNDYYVITSAATDETVVSGASGESDMRDWSCGIEDEAVARLIAAAPDLYEALDEAINYIVVWMAAYGSGKDGKADAFLNKCTAALAKARGSR